MFHPKLQFLQVIVKVNNNQKNQLGKKDNRHSLSVMNGVPKLSQWHPIEETSITIQNCGHFTP